MFEKEAFVIIYGNIRRSQTLLQELKKTKRILILHPVEHEPTHWLACDGYKETEEFTHGYEIMQRDRLLRFCYKTMSNEQ